MKNKPRMIAKKNYKANSFSKTIFWKWDNKISLKRI